MPSALSWAAPGAARPSSLSNTSSRMRHPERPVIYFSTVSEPLEKIVRFGQSLNFFDRTAIGTSVFYEDLGGTVNQHGLAGVTEQISAAIKERRPGLIVIDSFKALHAFANDLRPVPAVPARASRAAERVPDRLGVGGRIRGRRDRLERGIRRGGCDRRADHGQVRFAGGTDPGGQEAQGQRFLVRCARVPDQRRRAAAVSAARRCATRRELSAERRAGVIRDSGSGPDAGGRILAGRVNPAGRAPPAQGKP